MSVPTVVVSCGDPAGIGPEVVVRAVADLTPEGIAVFQVVGDAAQVRSLAERLGMPAPDVVPAGDATGVMPGQPSAAAAHAAVDAVTEAVGMVVRGRANALATGPISKEGLRLAGYDWPGQTEMLAALTGADDLRVLLMGPGLRVVHVSAHRTLRAAIDGVTRDRVLRTIQLADDIGRRMTGRAPRIAVAGLNPHAGEGGILGDEDEAAIRPAVDDARSAGVDATGPLSADSLFPRAVRGEFDLVVAMYHDQGHIPVKLLSADEGVAVTLGLPFLRTSPDHGAAFDLAGSGTASWTSMRAALRVAAEVAARDLAASPGRSVRADPFTAPPRSR
jgi:4-phospho-D-threonate 3-dehydrogenase / 4-phospho-D-erythronate 3-dehydrogenase